MLLDKHLFNKTLQEKYTLQNIAKVKELRRWNIWRAKNMPDVFKHWIYKDNGDTVIIPMWWLAYSYPHLWKQEHKEVDEFIFNAQLRDNQKDCLKNLLKHRTGIVNAGTGVGKSYMILYLAATLKRKTLIVVTATTLLAEMVQKCQELLWETPTAVGWTKKYKATTQDITVCMLQSLSKIDMTEYGAILVDECDQAISTEARQKLWYDPTPDYLYWFTATLEVNDQESHLINIYFWLPESSLMEQNFTPRIHWVYTTYMYSGSLDTNAEFSKMMTEVSEDTSRNKLIIDTIAKTLPKTETKKWLLLVKRTEQAEVFKKLLSEKWIASHILIGDTPHEERKRVIEEVTSTSSPVVLIGSAQILGRWFDLPALQSVYIQYPNKFDQSLIQVCWRVMRKHPQKTYCEIYDFIDALEWPLRSQAQNRRTTYKRVYWVTSISYS